MSTFRSYFLKNNTLITDNETNNSQNPVTELIYGTEDATISRFIFKIDLADLAAKIASESIGVSKIQKHELNICNTIAVRSDLIGRFMEDDITRRATSFELRLFVIPQEWDEGGGYEFYYNDNSFLPFNRGASNWFYRSGTTRWTTDGILNTGTTILATQRFDKGNEHLKIDITNFINAILYSGATHHGLGIAYTEAFEEQVTEERFSVGFHTKYTHTFFEPFLETTFSDIVLDDRKYFYADKVNKLFLIHKKGGVLSDVTVNSVQIRDYNNLLIQTITGTSISKVRTGMYSVNVTVDSAVYPDAVLFTDTWNLTDSSGKAKTIEQSFYVKNYDEYYTYNQINRFEPDNIHFTFKGIGSGEIIQRGAKRRIIVDYKQFYETNEVPFDLEYRLFTRQGGNVDINVINFTKVDRILNVYEFTLDTSWLIPADYFLELKVIYDGSFAIKSPIKFRIQSQNQNFSIL
jgi:hypothetical protein